MPGSLIIYQTNIHVVREICFPIHCDLHRIRLIKVQPRGDFPFYDLTIRKTYDGIIETIFCIDQLTITVSQIPVDGDTGY